MVLDKNIVKKNSNEFSFTKEAISEVVNTDFKKGAKDFYKILASSEPKKDTQQSYIWSALSGVSDEIGSVLYEKVLNYIDDISNIDTCEVKALESMMKILGTDYTVFSTFKDMPLEILDLMNVFSVRKDYLLDNQKVCAQLKDKLNRSARASGNLSGVIDNKAAYDSNFRTFLNTLNTDRSSYGFEEVSAANFIQSLALDDTISSTYYQVLSDHVVDTYNSISNEVIYKVLSNEILCSGFDLPNKYSDEIEAAKVRWNIPAEFDVSKEKDLIDEGLSTYESYTTYQQRLIDIETKRRDDPKYELENRTRYSYYKEADVRSYFKFIENEYNQLNSTYNSSTQYDLDHSYIQIERLGSGQSLLTLDKGELKINAGMIAEVALKLLTTTNSIRSIREQLKSQAQKTYMKGTYLLLAYVINEYLKDNTYPVLQALGQDVSQFPIDSNKLDLIEYVDQTNYNNIRTDIKEDITDTSLNQEYWKGIGAAGNGDSIDTTNIFRPEDKSQLVNAQYISQDQMRDFYLNVLGNFQAIDRLDTAAADTTLYSFLSSVFAVGADNSYLDSHGKVMCELQNTLSTSDPDEYQRARKFTVSQDQYIYDVSAAYDGSKFILSSYDPVDNITIHNQLDEALGLFNLKSQSAYDGDLQDSLSSIQDKIRHINSSLDDLEQLNEQFNNLTSQYSNLTASYLQYTGDYAASTSPYFRNQLIHYSKLVQTTFVFPSRQLKNDLQIQIMNIESLYNQLTSSINNLIGSTYYATGANVYQFTFSQDPLKLTILIDFKEKTIEDIILPGTEQKKLFEYIYEQIHKAADSCILTLNTKSLAILQDASNLIQRYLSETDHGQYDTLSLLLSSHYEDQFKLTSCVTELSARLDYEKSDWYAYKKSLFYKYSGLSVADTPFYYIENKTHPSYQIHPCLSNFIEYIDFSYPVKNLAGIAQSTIEMIAKTNLQVAIDSYGYLLSVWNNPLNGNGDYLTRYEKSSHVDALNQDNCLFGYDGPFYPPAVYPVTSGIEAAHTSMMNYSTVETSWYKGLNIEDLERKTILAQLEKFKTLIKEVTGDSTSDIMKYGLDSYGNSYILIKSAYSGNSPTLWMKAKNHPYAFPAIAYESNGKYSSASQITFEEGRSNNMFKDVKKATFLTGTTKTSTGITTPIINDFIFSKDRSTMILMCQSSDGTKHIPIHVNIRQEFVRNETYCQFLRYFDFDQRDKSETCQIELTSSYPLTSFYCSGNDVGIMYVKHTASSLSVLIDLYQNRDLNLRSQMPLSGAFSISNQFTAKSGDPKIDVKPDGSFEIAYVGSKTTPLSSYTTYSQQTADYTQASTTSYTTTHDKCIVVKEFTVAGSQILESTTRRYLPFSEIGFIPVLNTDAAILSGSTLQADLDNGKAMKFELYGISVGMEQGIDFKFTCPLRSWEADPVSYKDNSYHRDGTGDYNCYQFGSMHYFESQFNKYVLENDDSTFWDATDAERSTYLSVRNTDNDVFSEYVKLANYDVQQYLSVMRDEDYTYNRDIPDDQSLQIEEMDYITQPYLLPLSSLSTVELSTYRYGYYSGMRDIPHGSFKIEMNFNTLSVSWLINDVGTIKLDFNPMYYTTTDSKIRTSNVRNNLHLFLNLDRPGDAGYLMLYGDEEKTFKNYKLFIKNISYGTHPRFVMKKVDLDMSLNTAPVTGVTTSKLKAIKGEIDVPTLAAEGFETRYIQFT